MLDQADVTANIAAADLARASAFDADKLGLTPVHEVDGVVLLYRTGRGSAFTVYQTEHAGRAGHTIAQWDGDVSFTEGMGHAAWFRDSEDNVLCLDSGFPTGLG